MRWFEELSIHSKLPLAILLASSVVLGLVALACMAKEWVDDDVRVYAQSGPSGCPGQPSGKQKALQKIYTSVEGAESSDANLKGDSAA